MRILWLTVDRTFGTNSRFDDLRLAMSKLTNVDSIVKPIHPLSPGNYCKVIMSGQLKETPILDNIDMSQYDVVLTDAIFGYMFENWQNIKIHKAVLLEDPHGPMVKMYVNAAYSMFGFHTFILRYKEATLRFHSELSKRNILWSPHSISSAVINNKVKQPKTIKCLSIGVIDNYYYPFRLAAHNLLCTEPYYKRISITDNIRGQNYIETLRNSTITLCCPTVNNYPVRKYFEIPINHSVIFSPWCNELGVLGIENGKHMVVTSIDTLKQDIKYYLNSSKLVDIAEQSFQLISTTHTTEIRASKLLKDLKESL
jgi:hypothetical protein